MAEKAEPSEFQRNPPNAQICANFHFLRKRGCRRLLCIGSRPLNGNIYWMSPLSFSRSSISVPLTFFRTTLSISFSLKDSGASLMGFLSMA